MKNIFAISLSLLLLSSQGLFANPVAEKNKTSTPFSFRENKGQITDQYYNTRSDIQYKLQTQDVTVFVGNGQLHYQWIKTPKQEVQHKHTLPGENAPEPAQVTADIYRMDVVLAGANTETQIVAEEGTEDTETYYTNTSAEGIQASAYQKITYKNVYPHIDWVLYTHNSRLKYDFIVHPGGRVSDIQLRYEGANTLTLKDGAAIATTPMGSITEDAPYVYEQQTGKTVSTSYMLDGNTLRFEAGSYTGTLVIDPSVAWGTYYGGTLQEDLCYTTTDNSGNVYLAGSTLSTNNIATTGTHMSTASFGRDGYIAKFNSRGQRLWGTYYGSNNDDYILSTVCDKHGNILVTGYTNSTTNIASAGSHQSTYGGGTSDAFLAKFSPSGQRLWGTYLGGSAGDRAQSVAVDTADNIYIAGYTLSSSGIATTGGHQPTIGSTTHLDGFFAKFSPTGTRQWGSYYGGIQDDLCLWITTDTLGYIYMCGSASSNNNIGTPSSYQPTRAGVADGFWVKLDQAGIRLYSTYLGGTGSDALPAIHTDNDENVYVALNSWSTDLPVLNAHQTTYSGQRDGYLAKFNKTGNLVWSTYYGGTADDDINSLNINVHGNLIAGGYTLSNNNIASPNGYQTTKSGTDLFFTEFTPTGQRVYGSYFGGPGGEGGCVFADQAGNIYLSGETGSTTGISTPGGFQPAISSTNTADAFLVRLNPDTIHAVASFSPAIICPTDTLRVFYTTNKRLQPGNILTVQLSDSSGSFLHATVIGQITADTSGSIFCTINQPIAGSRYKIRIVSSAPYYISDPSATNLTIRYKVPTVNITNSPNTPILPAGATVTFTAIPVNGGNSPRYQWRMNGADIAGAATDQYTTNSLVTGDVVSVWIKSNDPCAQPDTAVATAMAISFTDHVADVAKKRPLNTYPNPNRGYFTISARSERIADDEAVRLKVYSPIGQLVYEEVCKASELKTGRRIDLGSNAAPGIYHIDILSGHQQFYSRVTIL